MLDFLTAADSGVRTSIPNFSTIPQWLWAGNGDRSSVMRNNSPRPLLPRPINPPLSSRSHCRRYYPDDPLGEVWDYEQGGALADPTGKAVGDYYGRLLAHYVEGGCVDEGGRFIPGYNLTFSHWEVLNELEHGLSPELYTILYDAIVAGILRWCPNGAKNMKFMGLALGGIDLRYITYFLNKTNHVPGIPIDAISFHHYAGSNSRDGGANASDYSAFFPSGEDFVGQIVQVQAARAASDYPNVIMDADEVGIILPDDNDGKWTSTAPGYPAVYWNAAAAYFAYLFGRTAQIGFDVLGESQLIGYPSIPFQRGPPINGPWTAPPQYPSVSILSWGGAFGNQGDGTARYWVLKLLLDEFKAIAPAGSFAPADADVLVNTSVVAGSSAPVSSPFCAEVLNVEPITMYCATAGAQLGITFASYGTPTGGCGQYAVNASCNTPNSLAIVQGFCNGKQSCTFNADTPTFGDPCYGTVKRLVVEATCSVGGGAQLNSTQGVYAQAFVESAGSGGKKVLVVNKGASTASVTLAGASGGAWQYIDESTAYGPAAITTLASDTWTLAPYALGLLRLS